MQHSSRKIVRARFSQSVTVFTTGAKLQDLLAAEHPPIGTENEGRLAGMKGKRVLLRAFHVMSIEGHDFGS